MAGTDDIGPLVNVLGKEIIQTGIEYPLSSGPATFTTEDLADAVASQDDPAIKSPRLRLGHEGLDDPAWDGEPAIGTLGNLRLAQEGHLIVGDYMGIPDWLAKVLPSAYPACSIDGQMGVETNTGHNWRLVVTDLALLGVRWPGVSTLEDIKALYSTSGPDNVTIYATEEEVMAGTGTVTARTDVDDVRRQFYNQLESGQYWWWVRSQYYDPNELIVEDEESGELYRVPFTTNDDGEASFDDPVAVRIEYEDKPVKEQPEETKAAILAGLVFSRQPAKVFASRDDSRKDVTVAGTATSTVDPAVLRQAFGLTAEATDEELSAAMGEAGFVAPPGQEGSPVAPGSEQPGTTDTSASSGDGGDNQAPANSGGDPANAQPTTPPSGAVMVDAARLASLEARAARGDQALTRFEHQDRDSVINAAISAGKVPKSRESHWQTQWGTDPEGTRHLLTASVDKGGLAPGLIPVTEVGSSPGDGSLDDSGYPAEWLPEVAAAQAQQRQVTEAGQVVPFTRGGLINRRM
jgi:hypothetical protein